MKLRLIASGALVVALCAGFGMAAQAGTISTFDSFGSTGGGEFGVDVWTGGYFVPPASVVTQHSASTDYFHTFCIESNEYLSHSTTYTWVLNTAAVNGGSGGGSPDPISDATAKLFYAFWADAWVNITGYSADYDYGNNATRVSNADALQQAIWYLENESGGVNNSYVSWAQNVTWAQLGQSGWTGIGNVRVLNLYDSAGGLAQDLLIVVPLPLSALTGIVMLAGLGVLWFVRRRMHAVA